MNADRVHVGLLAPILAACKSCNLDSASLFERAGLRADAVLNTSEAVPLECFLRLLETAATGAGERFFGVKAGLSVRLTDVNLVGALMASASTLRGALDDLARSYILVKNAADLRIVEQGDRVALVYDTAVGVARGGFQDPEFTLASALGLLRSLAASDWSPVEVRFSYSEPSRSEALARLLGAPVLFRQPSTALVFRRSDLDCPVFGTDYGIRPILERHLAELLPSVQSDRDLVRRVRAIVDRPWSQSEVSLRFVADELDMSPRSLQRRLSASGTSLRAILRDHRMDCARAMLSNNTMTHSEIADALGYSDGTVFWRAYRSWTGRSPSEARRRMD